MGREECGVVWATDRSTDWLTTCCTCILLKKRRKKKKKRQLHLSVRSESISDTR